ncbi:LysE family translocator [Chloroflexi bacterium TSY]|nr:LysE family translocator [Chloroflexi bacterium TSY]
MPDLTSLSIFLSAAIILAITPGPGIFYVLMRSIKGGRSEGIASTFGTAIGGMFHVFAAALGLSAILATSAIAFSIVKYAGAAYLIYLGIRIIHSRDEFDPSLIPHQIDQRGAFRQGIVTEMLNPKTALFFLAFIPQFIHPEGVVVFQFILLGGLSVLLNSTADLIVAFLAGPLGSYLANNVKLRQGQRIFSGFTFIALGTYVAAADNK